MKALPPDTVRLLSSSQVIGSVLSVVKELVENSLDAGATSVEVKLENHGLDRVEVRDNGCGIEAAHAPVMAVKHYTSKISSLEDLGHLQTYGFRGEALASICAVSEVTITSRTAEDQLSTRYALDVGGHVVSRTPSHLGPGTTVCALKLFKNVPVRRQFYSNTHKCREELRKVQDLLMAYAVIKPELRVVLTHNKVVAWQKARARDHAAALAAVLGSAVATELSPVHHRHQEAQISVDGYLPKPTSDPNTTSSGTADKTFIFINDRPVHHREILKLIRQCYTYTHGARGATRRRYPILMMNIGVPASAIDVNLTPDKMMVMFHNQDAVLLAVESALISLYGPFTVGNEGGGAGRGLERPAEDPGPTETPGGPTETPGGPTEDPGSPTETPGGPTEDPGGPTNDPGGPTETPGGPTETPGGPTETPGGPTEDPGGPTETPGGPTEDPEASLPSTANTSSSSSSEDWINRSFGVSSDFVGGVSAESWAAGTAFKGAVSGEHLGPACLLPAAPEAAPRRTAYDLIRERSVARATPEHRGPKPDPPPQGVKRKKSPPPHQRTLDGLFSSGPRSKRDPAQISRPVGFSLESLRRWHRRGRRPDPRAPGLRAVNPLPSHGAWVVSEGPGLLLLNPFRAQEALLFKRLSEGSVLPAASLQTPLRLTDGVLGGEGYMDVLLSMERSGPDPRGEVRFTDARLVANGFEIRLVPGASPPLVEVTAMSDCMPFYGVSDLKEILTAVRRSSAGTVRQCRPLKVTNYLEAEAVRMARQLPLTTTRDDVSHLLSRMELEEARGVCLHGRPIFHSLVDVPETEQDARRMVELTKTKPSP